MRLQIVAHLLCYKVQKRCLKFGVPSIERYKKEKKDSVTSNTVIDVDGTKKEITKLESRADKYSHAYSEGVFSLEKLLEYLNPIKKQIEGLKNDLAKASVENLPKTEMMVSSDTDIKFFTKEARKLSATLSFEAKKGIMSTTLDKVYSNQGGIQVYGALNLHQIYVNFFTCNRNCWTS